MLVFELEMWQVFDSCFSEGLAVGVGFGAVGKTPSATFESARYVINTNTLLWECFTNNVFPSCNIFILLSNIKWIFGRFVDQPPIQKTWPENYDHDKMLFFAWSNSTKGKCRVMYFMFMQWVLEWACMNVAGSIVWCCHQVVITGKFSAFSHSQIQVHGSWTCCCDNSGEHFNIGYMFQWSPQDSLFLHQRNLPATRKRERKRDNKCAHHTARWNLLSIAENQSSIVAIEPPGLDCRNSMRSCVPLCMCAVCVCVCVHACDSDCHPDVS